MKERTTLGLALIVLAFLLCCLPALVEGPDEACAAPGPVHPTAAVLKAEGCLLPEMEKPPTPVQRVMALPMPPARQMAHAPDRDSNGHPLTLTAAYVDAVPEAFPPESVKG